MNEQPPDRGFEEETDIRKGYLLALAADLGADTEKARENIESMFEFADDLADIDYSRDPDDMEREDPDTFEKIKAIGLCFLPEGETEFAFNIGVQALSLMRDEPGGKGFTRLPEMVRIWTAPRKGEEILKKTAVNNETEETQ